MAKAACPLLLLLSIWCAGCTATDTPLAPPLPTRPAFLEGDTAAALARMDSLDMEARIAQLMMVPLYSKPGEPESAADVAALIVDLGVGGVIAMQGDKANTARNLHHLDSLARATSGVGLLSAMDAEWGSGMRLPDGIRFPKAMALGAIEDVDLIRQAGRVAGYELRALGVDMDFAPVVDVNSNPDNPVIGNRSFGSDPAAVGERGLAWAEGLRAAGVMACAKHFPGHGDADLDSHLALPRILSDSSTLASVELPPFRHLINGGVEGVMTAHLEVPALDSVSGLPTSLSQHVIGDLLIDSLGFEGLVFTDALTMAGVAEPVPPGTREIEALRAGNNILLFPSSPALVIDSIMAALQSGRLDTARVNAACLKVLLAKQWGENTLPMLGQLHLPSLQQALRGHMLTRLGPLHDSRSDDNLTLVVVGNRGDALAERLRLTHPDLTVIRHGKSALAPVDIAGTVRRAAGSDRILLAFLDESNRPSRQFGIPEGSAALVSALADLDADLDIGVFTSPYALQHLAHPADAGWLVAYHEDGMTQTAAAAAWCQEGPALGRLPVDVGPWKSGMGHPTQARRLPRAAGNAATERMRERLDSLAGEALAMDATPGLRLLVLADDSIRLDLSYGTLGDSSRTPVTRESVYDLASITKVTTSTLLTMMAVERGMLDLDRPLADILPERRGVDLDRELGRRSLKDLLAHRSGMPAWIPFYLDLMAHDDSTGSALAEADTADVDGWIELRPGRWMDPAWCDTIHHRIRTTEPGEPGSYRYSDLGYYLLQDVLESLWDQPLDQLADSLIHRPLGLTRIGYRPLSWCNGADIAPTELDTVFRKHWVRGTVHDPGASMMGGVAGHAGLFSDAHDLAVILETLRRGGEWNGVRLVRPETVEAFTTRAFPEEDNRRAIGWDKPGLEEDSGASGNAGSWSSFGHSGFTGTLAWTDPEGRWTAVFLSNRICPDAENRTLIREDIRTQALFIIEEELGFPHRFDAPDSAAAGSNSPR
ncbi:MAG: glycoside hydrolase family 3 N-terminal domain-containing protein [Flavobacteriales bacterium]